MVCLRISLVLVLYRNQNSSGIVNQILKIGTSPIFDVRTYLFLLAEFGERGER
jgi:hypothetical protein